MREHVLTAAVSHIIPVFVLEGNNKVEDVKSMPGVSARLHLLLKDAEQCVKLGIPGGGDLSGD